MNVGQKIIELRLENGLSQSQLAEQLKIGQTTLSKWERDESSLKFESAIKLAKFFKISLEYLAGIEKY